MVRSRARKKSSTCPLQEASCGWPATATWIFSRTRSGFHRDGRLRVYGTTRIDSKSLSPECQNEMFDVMAAPLQKHVVNAANGQIESTKEILNMPAARGLLQRAC